MRDYTVGGPEAKFAEVNGLIDADWYKPKVDREMMKNLWREATDSLRYTLHHG